MLDKMFRKEIRGYKTKELMTKHVITLPPEANLLEAQHKMLRYKIKKIVVVNANTIGKKVPIGILTVKDIIKSALSHETDADLYEMRISEAMTKSLVIVEQNDSVLDCAKLLKENRNVGSAIVVKGDNNYPKGKQSPANQKLLLSGIITPTDLARFYSENCIGYTSVITYMSHRFITISINERVSAAAQLMIDQNTSQLVVTAADSQNSLLGILSETDIARVISTFKSKTLRSVYENIGILFSSFKRNSTAVEPALVRVQDIFTPNPTIIEKGADLAEAAKIMIRQGINGMPVVESLEERTTSGLVGIISKTDIVKALAEIP